MATCNKCGGNVGCGCNLEEGMCPSCYQKYQEKQKLNKQKENDKLQSTGQQSKEGQDPNATITI